MQEQTSPLARVQSEAVQVSDLLAEARRRLKAQLTTFPADVEDVSDQVVIWEQCPPTDFFVHGALSAIVSDLEELHEYLRRTAEATPGSIRRQWLELREAEELVKAVKFWELEQ